MTIISCGIQNFNEPNQLVGTYSLLEWKGIKPDGHVIYPYGEQAEGLLHYDELNRMSMQLQRSDRDLLGTDDYDSLDAELIREAFKGFFSYYGRYSLDQKSGVITQHIEGCKNPDWEGRTLKRAYALSGDLLTIQSDSVIGMNHILLWKRISE